MQYSKEDIEQLLKEQFKHELKKENSDLDELSNRLVSILVNNNLLVAKLIDKTFKATHRMRVSNLVHGVGNMDMKLTSEFKGAYETWRHMLRRSYANEYKDRKPSYENCTVSEEWLTFSNFLKFYQSYYRPGFQLDKDILVRDNKIYSKDTCCFVPPAINGVIVNIEGLGVSFDNHKQKYRASMSYKGKGKHLGYYTTAEDANTAYKQAKKIYVNEIVDEYLTKGDITRDIADALLSRVSNW